MLWAKEYYWSKYATQGIVLSECKIDIQNSFVYAAIQQPVTILKINAVDGSTIYTKVLFNSGAFYTSPAIIWDLGFMTANGLVVAYISDGSGYDYVIQFSSTDFTTNIAAYLLFAGLPNSQAVKHLRFVSDGGYAEAPGLIAQNNIWNFALLHLVWGSGTTLAAYEDFLVGLGSLAAQPVSMYPMAYYQGGGNFMRMACVMSNFNLAYQNGTSVGLYFQANGNLNYYVLVNGVTPPSSVDCRDVIITSDFRPFVFLNNLQSTNTYGSQMFASIMELINPFSSTTMTMTVTYMQAYQSNFFAWNSNFNIFPGPTTGMWQLMYAIDAFIFAGGPTRPHNNGFLMSVQLSAAGTIPVFATLNCGAVPASTSLTISPVFSIPYTAVSNVATVSTFSISDDTPTYVGLQSQDIPQYLIYQPGCPGSIPPAPFPLYLPYIQNQIYYVIGVDNLITLGIKQFPLAVNASIATLTTCQQDVVTYEVRMKNLQSLPACVTIDRSLIVIVVNNPTVAMVGTYVLQIMISDIFGNSQALDFTLTIENLSNPGLANCFSEPGVLPIPYVYDTLYVIGSQKHIKIQMTVPRTAANVDCESFLAINANSLDASNTVYNLPSFMTLDLQNRQIITYIPSAQSAAYINKTYNITITIYIAGNTLVTQSTQFKIFMVKTQQLGCPYYYQIDAPVIPNYVLQQSAPTPANLVFTPFKLSTTLCPFVQIQNSIVQSNGSPVPTCVQVNFATGQLIVSASQCVGTFQIRLDAWAVDPIYNIKVLQTNTQFQITIVGATNCIGQIGLNINALSYYFTSQYSNVDSPTTVTDQFSSVLSIQPSSLYQPLPTQIGCDSVYICHKVPKRRYLLRSRLRSSFFRESTSNYNPIIQNQLRVQLGHQSWCILNYNDSPLPEY